MHLTWIGYLENSSKIFPAPWLKRRGERGGSEFLVFQFKPTHKRLLRNPGPPKTQKVQAGHQVLPAYEWGRKSSGLLAEELPAQALDSDESEAEESDGQAAIGNRCIRLGKAELEGATVATG